MQQSDKLGEQVSGPVLVVANANQVVMTDPHRVAELDQSGAELHIEKEPVGNHVIAEGGLQQTGENDQVRKPNKKASNGIDIAVEGLLADILVNQTNFVDPTMQHGEEQDQLRDVIEGHEIFSNETSSGSDSGSSSGSELDTELGKCFYPSFEALENSRPPEVGMKFPTLEDAERSMAHMLC